MKFLKLCARKSLFLYMSLFFKLESFQQSQGPHLNNPTLNLMYYHCILLIWHRLATERKHMSIILKLERHHIARLLCQ